MKKAIRSPAVQTVNISVCDRCGEESLQDDLLREYEGPHIPSRSYEQPEKILLHSACMDSVRKAARKSWGLLV